MGQKTNSIIFRLGQKNSEWKHKYIEKNKEESSIFLYKTVEIQKYINNTLKFYNIMLHSCKIEYTPTEAKFNIALCESNLDIANQVDRLDFYNSKKKTSVLLKNILSIGLNLYIKNKIVNVKIQNLTKKFELNIKTKNSYYLDYKRVLPKLKRFLKAPYQKNFIKLLFIVVSEKGSAKLIADSIAFYITKNKKRHNYLLFILKFTLTEIINLNFSKIKGIKIVINGRFNGAPRAKQKLLKIGVIPLQSFNTNVDYYHSTSYTQNGTFGVKVWICER